MKTLQQVFIKAGFRHELIERDDKFAIYKRTMIGCSHIHYEVIQIGSHNGYKLGKAYLEAAETYPGASLWGIQGWTANSLETAKIRFDKLIKKREKKVGLSAV